MFSLRHTLLPHMYIIAAFLYQYLKFAIISIIFIFYDIIITNKLLNFILYYIKHLHLNTFYIVYIIKYEDIIFISTEEET